MLITLALLLVAIVAVVAIRARARRHPGGGAPSAVDEAAGAPSRAEGGGGRAAVVEEAHDHQTSVLDAGDGEPPTRRTLEPTSVPAEEKPPGARGPFTAETQDQLGNYRFDSFVVGAGNRSAYRVAKAAAENPGLRFNPLFIYGGPGLGKTHLMCALASEVYNRDSDTRVRYLTSQAFAEQILDAYRSRQVGEFERRYIQTDVLLVDDIQLLAMSQSLQSVVASILGEMYEQGKQIAVSSDRRPEDLRGLAQEITARFATGVIVEVDRPDAALRTRILRRKARLGDWPLEDELLVYVAHSLNGDIRTLEGVAMKLVALKTLQGIRIDKTVVDGLMKEVTGDNGQSTLPSEGGWTMPQPAEAGPAAGVGVSGERSLAGIAEQARGAVKALPAVEEGMVEGEDVAPRRVNPLVREFSRPVPVARRLATPNEVASAVPQAAATSVVVLGTSNHLVMTTVEAMVGRGSHHVQSPGTASWAYMVHLQCDDPDWVLVGTSRWDRETELAHALMSHQPPAFVIVLDGEHPEIANAKELISSVPSEGGMAVVVLGSFVTDSTDALRKMLRCLLGVPQQFPVVVQGAVDTPGSRTWVKLALESRAPDPRCTEPEQAIGSAGSGGIRRS